VRGKKVDDVEDNYGTKTMERQNFEIDDKSKKLETMVKTLVRRDAKGR
jgi:hypothetical protein